ncbi:MAG: hypothetical protein HYY36_01380 [Gammaproteobacteria bacterium]|nr:hypothetical protein [Gammaproteobacteria bacterium]
MKRDDLDWSILAGALATLVVSLVVGGVLVAGSHYFQKKMALEYNRNNAQFQAISQRYLAVDEEEKLIKKFFPNFIGLYNGGVIGHEQRLNWIEVLRASGDDIGLPSLTYEIKSQSPYLPDFSVSLGRFQLYSSQMTLNMQLLHEGDMISLFDLLDHRAAGVFSVSACKFTRAGRVLDMNPSRGNVFGRCELNWFTINLSDGSEIRV